MAHATYGSLAEPPEVIFGVPRTPNPNANKAKFHQLSECVSTNLFTIQSSASNLERALKILGTKRDNQGLRDSLHVSQLSANQIINQTSQELAHLVSAAQEIGDRIFYLQAERLKNEFEKTLQHYSMLQKDIATKLKTTLPYQNWGEFDGQKQPGMFENVASERHQKLMELKQAEIEQQVLQEREERIRQIESDIIDVNQIMKELSNMVQEQGETINSIENNIERAYTHAEEGRQQLEKAATHQKTNRKWICFLVGLFSTAAIVIALVLYFELRPS